jgi:phage terminase large subunit-like protein
MLMFGMRLGADPRTVVTTTPRPEKLIRDLVRDPICVVTRGSSSENRGNLAPAFFDQIIRKYEGTRLGGCSDPFRSDTAAVPRVIPSCYRTSEFDRQTFS